MIPGAWEKNKKVGVFRQGTVSGTSWISQLRYDFPSFEGMHGYERRIGTHISLWSISCLKLTNEPSMAQKQKG